MTESSVIEIPFTFVRGAEYNENDRYPFWSLPTTVEWFEKRGYTLYHNLGFGDSHPSLPHEPYSDAQYPYPYHDSECARYGNKTPLLADDRTGKLVYAQETSSPNHHVAIKLVRVDSDEYRILKFLMEQPMEKLQENCILPVLELLPNGPYCFAVMPRWGCYALTHPRFTHLKEVVHIIHCMLKGLAFLHHNNIAHGDLSQDNVLINHTSNVLSLLRNDNQTRAKLRLEGHLTYALMDFDFSYMIPLDQNRNQFRLPYYKAWGTYNLTADGRTGDYDYNPFFADVGTLGVTLCLEFQGVCSVFHALAPLLDMMTTWDVRRRFTAHQALDFFETHVVNLTDRQLQLDISLYKRGGQGKIRYNRWQDVPPHLAEQWKMYKEIPEPWTRQMLTKICHRRFFWHIVPWTRWCLFQIFSGIPCRFYGWLFSPRIRI